MTDHAAQLSACTSTAQTLPHFTIARTRWDKLMTGNERGWHCHQRRRKFSFPAKFMTDATTLVRCRHGMLPDDTDDVSIYIEAVVAVTNRSPSALRYWFHTVGIGVTQAQAAHMVAQAMPMLDQMQ